MGGKGSGPRSERHRYITTSLKIEQQWLDICNKYKIPLREALKKGVTEILKSRTHQLSEDIFNILSQWERESIEKHQENIMYFERLAMDARIRDEARAKRNVEMREIDGNQVEVIVLEAG